MMLLMWSVMLPALCCSMQRSHGKL